MCGPKPGVRGRGVGASGRYSQTMEATRIGVVRYLNTAPLIEGLESVEGLGLVAAVPSRIADMVTSGEVDIGLVSTIDAARAGERLALIPAGVIGCDGPTLTVRIFSKCPPAEISTLAADTDSHTSVVLAQVILSRVFGVRASVVEFDARERMARGADGSDPWPESMLLIGDKVVTDSPPAVRYPYQVDLGEAWKSLTGLPFVYAIWMCRAAEAGSERIRSAALLLERQRLRNEMRLDWIVSRRAPEKGWPDDLARRYLGERLRFSCGVREREAVERFMDEAAGLGLIERPAVRWVSMSAASV